MERPDPQWGTVLVFSEFKGRKRTVKTHEMPILPGLRASIDAYRAAEGQAGQHLVYLPTAFGKPHSAKGFGNWFVDQCRRAGLEPGLSSHGLRKLAACRLLEAGATESQVMAWFGWTTAKEIKTYAKKVNSPRLEGAAAIALLQAQQDTGKNGNKTTAISGKKVPPFSGVPASGTISTKKL